MPDLANLVVLIPLPRVKLNARRFDIGAEVADLHAPRAFSASRFNDNKNHSFTDFNFWRLLNKFSDLTNSRQLESPLKSIVSLSARAMPVAASITRYFPSQNETEAASKLTDELAA